MARFPEAEARLLQKQICMKCGAMTYFEENYKENLTLEEAINMGIKAIHKGTEERLNPDAIEIAVLDTKERFRKLSRDESKNYVKKAIG